MLQIETFWDTYSISPPIYIYICSTLKFFDSISIEDDMPEKALKYALFQKM